METPERHRRPLIYPDKGRMLTTAYTMPEEYIAWVREHGGAAYIRRLIEAEMRAEASRG
jgi:hypothetical protein